MSWYSDMVFDQVVNDLVERYGYTREYAVNYLYTGGLRIYTPMVVEYQKIMDDYFSDESNYLPIPDGQPKQQVAMELLDPKTGNVLAVIGGRGKKDSARVLNRVTQTTRQPGSAIKPVTVYGYA
jgi:penicillin-binding protein 1A